MLLTIRECLGGEYYWSEVKNDFYSNLPVRQVLCYMMYTSRESDDFSPWTNRKLEKIFSFPFPLISKVFGDERKIANISCQFCVERVLSKYFLSLRGCHFDNGTLYLICTNLTVLRHQRGHLVLLLSLYLFKIAWSPIFRAILAIFFWSLRRFSPLYLISQLS